MAYLSYKSLDDVEIEKLIQKMIDISKKRGIKITTQRILIFKELLKHTKEHPSAEDIYENLKNKVYGLSLSTVYRALTTFEELGLIRRIPTPDGKAHYEIANEPHGHFICTRCGRIYDLEGVEAPNAPQIKEELKNRGFEVQACNAICYGICSDCSS